jgi:hypothetical protein
MDNIAQGQEWAEGLALIIAAYHDGLIRGNVPAELAADLTEQYQAYVLEQAAAAQARQANTQVFNQLFGKK